MRHHIRRLFLGFSVVPLAVFAAPEAALEEILVTARKRTESLSVVGLPVVALTPYDLARLHSVAADDIAQHVVNVDLNKPFGNANPVVVIRGVGLQDFNTNNTPAAGIYVDELYLPSNAMADFPLFDLERVELLKGPQGTLWGRNTIAGAVNFVTHKPAPTPELFTSLGYGSDNARRLEAAGGGALTRGVSARLAGMFASRDAGMFTNRLSGRAAGDFEQWSARGQLAAKLSDRVNALLSLSGASIRGDSYPLAHVGIVGTDCPISASPPAQGDRDETRCGNAFTGYSDPDGDPRTGDWNEIPRMSKDGFQAFVRLEGTSDRGVLTSITAWQDFEFRRGEDDDASPIPLLDIHYQSDIDSVSQEFRWTSMNAGSLAWIAGLQAARDDHDEDRVADLSGLFPGLMGPVRLRYAQRTDSLASFGNLRWSATQRTTLGAGLRYTHEHFSFVGGTTPVAGTFDPDFLAVAFPGLPATVDHTQPHDDLSGQLEYEFRWTSETLLWARVAKGFKSGGVFGGFGQTAQSFTPYDPESLYACEIGARSSIPSVGLHLDLSGFFYDYRDLQAQTLVASTTGAVAQLANIGDAEIYGVEASVAWQPLAGLSLQAGLGLLHSRVLDQPLATDSLQRPLTLRGHEMPHAPNPSASASMTYDLSLSSELMCNTSIDVSYKGTYYNDVQNQEHLRQQDATTLVGARLSLRARARPWEAALWGRNLTDARYIVHGNSSGVGNDLLFYGEPRSYGLELRYQWR